MLRSTMIPIPKWGKVCSRNADLNRNIAVSSILSKILDHVIVDQNHILWLQVIINLVLNLIYQLCCVAQC